MGEVDRGHLLPAIGRISTSFQPDELAYLALTSKVERPILDRLAFELHRELSTSSFLVAREYCVCDGVHADIAVLDRRRQLPILAIEGKAHSSFDCIPEDGKPHEYADRLQRDLDRYRKLAHDCPDVYCLFLGTHLSQSPDQRYAKAIKSCGRYSQAFQGRPEPSRIRQLATERFTAQLDNLAGSGIIEGGTAFGVQVEILYFLFGPFRAPARLSIYRSTSDTPRA